MTTFDTKSLKKESRDRLSRISGDPRLLIGLYTGVIVAINLLVSGLNLALDHQIGSTGGLGGLGTRSILETIQSLIGLYTGVIVAINLLVSGLNLALDHQIGSTGGLGGLGTRSILETIQSILTYASVIFTPFWSAGFLYCVIRIVRGDPADPRCDPRCLMEGFRRFPSVLLFHVNKLVLTMMIGTTATYLAAIVFMLTPFSAGLEQLTAQAMEAGNLILADGTVNLQVFDPGALVRACIPMLVIFGLLFLPAYLFLSYSLRLSPYLIMGDQRMGGFACIANSFRLMRGNRLKMLRLDLSFWWYYLIDSALTVILYLDLILPLMGIELPFNQTVRGNRLKMLRLDLSFWWYYLIDSALTVILYLDLILPLMGIELPFNQTVAFFVCLILYGAAQAAFYYLIDSALTVILYLDLILPLMGIELPFNQTVAFFVCLILYGAAQAAFYMWKKLPVDTTYVLAYDAVAGADAPQQD